MSERKLNQKEERSEVKTFPIPFNLGEIKENIIITTNGSFKPSKEEIVKQAYKFTLKGAFQEAAKYYQYFIDQGFIDHRVYSNYGVILRDLGDLQEAEVLQRKAIELNPDFENAHFNLGIILKDLGNLEEAELFTRKAIELNPDFADAHSNLGIILREIGDLQAAELSTRKAIELKPDFANNHSNLGIIFKDLGKLKAAELSYRKAIELDPKFSLAYSNLGNVLRARGKLTEAEKSIRKAIELKPDFADAYYNLGTILKQLGNFGDAANQFKQAIKSNNDFTLAKTALITAKGSICDWSEEGSHNIYLKSIGIKGTSISPWDIVSLEDNPLNHLKRAKNFYKEKYTRPTKHFKSSKKDIIHIGYFSADFRDHPVMKLIARLLELHDKSRFKIYLYSFVPKEDEYTERAKNSGCIFRKIENLNDIEAVELARSDKLDIAVDLMGYTHYNRMPIFSYRVAPIQINYLGYPASVGSDVIDYIIADKVVIPNSYEKFYTEKVIRMPNCYLCTDDKIKQSKAIVTRNDFNLPEKGFVFTCFNDMKKITPNEFDIWMRLLKEVKGSVLWLKSSNELAIDNLRKEARKRNVDPKRLIFANRVPFNLHLARLSLGDLGLDTFNFNGHSTTLDALLAGLPILTKLGESFVARVSSSLLTSIGMPELITYDEEQYEETAIRIANNHNEIFKLKSKLEKLKNKSSLFNSKLYTQDLENIYLNLIQK